MSLHREINFETEICDHLAAHGWIYAAGDDKLYDRARALFPPDLVAWVQATQPDEWAKLKTIHGDKRALNFLARLTKELDNRGKFDVRFYLVAILFIIFDLEVAFLFPWAISLRHIGVFGWTSMMVFLGVLAVGFVYEWKKGALEWE